MQYEFDFAVFIGRFQPFHNGHLQVVGNCLAKAEKTNNSYWFSWAGEKF